MLLARPQGDAGGAVTVRSRAGRFTVPAEQADALDRFLSAETLAVADLDPDPEVALALARSLVRRGVAVPVDL